MAPAILDLPEREELNALAKEAIEDGVHAAKRAMKSIRRGVEQVEDLKDEAIHRVKRQPLQAVGVGFGVGIAMGFAAGWFARRTLRARRD